MNKDKFSKWLDAILHEDGHNLSCGSVTTIRLIKEELKKPLDESFSSSPDEEWPEGIKKPDWLSEQEKAASQVSVGEPKQSECDEQDKLWEQFKELWFDDDTTMADIKKQFHLIKK